MRTAEDFDVPASGGRQLSRRSVIKAGAHAAWVVPAIQVVGAAPAFANGSGCACPNPDNAFVFAITAAWNQQGGSDGKKWVVDFFGTITNKTGSTVSELTVCISVPRSWTSVHTHSTTGWDDSYGDKKTGNPRVMYFTSKQVTPNNGTWSFSTVHIKDDGASSAKHSPTTLTLVATANGHSSSTAVSVTG